MLSLLGSDILKEKPEIGIYVEVEARLRLLPTFVALESYFSRGG